MYAFCTAPSQPPVPPTHWMEFSVRFRANREQLNTFLGLLPEGQGQNPALTVSYAAYSLDSGYGNMRQSRPDYGLGFRRKTWISMELFPIRLGLCVDIGQQVPSAASSGGAVRADVHTPHPTPYTPHPTPYTLHPTPYTLHPTPYTLHPTPYTLHPAPTPYTLHPTPYTLHPTTYTPHPTPCTPHSPPYTRANAPHPQPPKPLALPERSIVARWGRQNSAGAE